MRWMHETKPYLKLALPLVLAALLPVAGCGSDPAGLVGTWTNAEQGETLERRYDGTAILVTEGSGVGVMLNWEADSKNLVITGSWAGDRRTLGYSLRDGVLKLTYPGEGTVEYRRSDAVLD